MSFLTNKRIFWLAILMLVSFPVYAQIPDLNSINPQTILKNITEAVPNLMRMVTAIAYVMGMLLIVRAIAKMKHLGEMRTMMSHEHSWTAPLLQLAIGAFLLYLPSSVQIGMSSFWTNPNPYGYIEQQDQWAQLIKVCFMVVQFIGTVAFIRGLVILSHAAAGSQQGGISRGLTHIIGGIFCINIYQFLQVIFATLGVGQ